MSLIDIDKVARETGLFGIAANAEGRISQAKADQLSYEDFLIRLLDDERVYRKEKTTKALLTRAKFRHRYTLEDWDTSYDRGIAKAKLQELGSCLFYQNRENLIISGTTGTGKSHLAVALGRQLCHKGVATRFYTTNLFFEEVAAQRAAGRYLIFLKGIAKVEAVVLDDFGLRKYSHEEATALMDLLEERYQRGVIILTSQVKPEGWKLLFEDPIIGEALLDRLQHPAQHIQLIGQSYRTKISKSENI
jgi:DNA replication protein DnaC